MSDQWDHIDAYLLGKLSSEAKSAFEERLKHDPALVEELEFRQNLQAGLQEVEAEDIRARVKAIANKKPKSNSARYWLAAASVVLVLGLGIWVLQKETQPNGQAIFATYYHPKIQLDQARGTNPTPTLLDTLSQRYEAEDFAFLQKRLSSLPDSSKNWNLQMLEAVSLIELDKDEAANALLTVISTSSAPDFAEQALWLKTLLQLRNEQYETATISLQLIASDTSKLHQAEALEILELTEGR